MAFQDGVFAEEAPCRALFLILKGVGDNRVIGLVEVVWKAVELILNCPFPPSITYHDSLHGFRSVCSTGTSTLEVKMIQKVATMREVVPHAIFLDLHKSYNSLYRAMGPEHPGGIWPGYQGPLPPLRVLGVISDGGSGEGGTTDNPFTEREA